MLTLHDFLAFLTAFADDFAEEVQEPSRPSSVSMETDFLQIDWVVELPEDLDVCIAQRDFEGAVDLAEKSKYFCKFIGPWETWIKF